MRQRRAGLSHDHTARTSELDVARAIFDEWGLTTDLQPTTTDAWKAGRANIADRPAYSVLDVTPASIDWKKDILLGYVGNDELEHLHPVPVGYHRREALREAHMRQCIRAAQKEGFERIAVGGAASPLLDSSLLPQRHAMPILPAGSLTGSRATTVRPPDWKDFDSPRRRILTDAAVPGVAAVAGVVAAASAATAGVAAASAATGAAGC